MCPSEPRPSPAPLHPSPALEDPYPEYPETPTLGDRVFSPTRRNSGTIVIDDATSYKVRYDDGEVEWCKREDEGSTGVAQVQLQHSVSPSRKSKALFAKDKLTSDGPVDEPRSLEEFCRRNRYFFVPWIILAALLYAMQFVAPVQAYFTRHGMQLFGFQAAAQLTIWCIMCSFAMHGFIAVNYDELVQKGLKVVGYENYNWQCGDASIRSSLIYFVGMMVYALVPMRVSAADDTWSKSVTDFLIGYTILLIGGDAYFYMVHRMFHTVNLYRKTHKTHHTWKHPLSFSAYYIATHTHMIQEHFFSLPCLLFLPVPMSAFMFWEYYGVPAAQMQHTGFLLDALRVPFCGGLKIGHIMTVFGLGFSFILGPQTIADHDYHHEHGTGNFALSYRYLDKIFGTYVATGSEALRAASPSTDSSTDASKPLLGV